MIGGCQWSATVMRSYDSSVVAMLLLIYYCCWFLPSVFLFFYFALRLHKSYDFILLRFFLLSYLHFAAVDGIRAIHSMCLFRRKNKHWPNHKSSVSPLNLCLAKNRAGQGTMFLAFSAFSLWKCVAITFLSTILLRQYCRHFWHDVAN